MMRDAVTFVDGPLEGHRVLVDGTTHRVLDVETEDGTFRYSPVIARDGEHSRGDDGCLRYYHVSEVDA